MALPCETANCRGRIAGAVGSGILWEGDEHNCPRCGATYIIGVTDDYEDDAIAFLIPKAPGVEQKPRRQRRAA